MVPESSLLATSKVRNDLRDLALSGKVPRAMVMQRSWATHVSENSRIVRTESCRTKVPRIFRNFVPNLPSCSEFSRIFEDFSCFFFLGSCFSSWETETTQSSQRKFLAFVNASPGKFDQKSTRVFWRARKVKNSDPPHSTYSKNLFGNLFGLFLTFYLARQK